MAKIYHALPEVLKSYNREFKVHIPDSHIMHEHERQREIRKLKDEGYYVRVIKVLSRNLRHKKDLHGKPYLPTKWIFKAKK